MFKMLQQQNIPIQQKYERMQQYIKNIPQWLPNEYFTETLKKWKAFTMIVTGSSKSGKSSLLKDLFVGTPNLIAKFDTVVVFSRTLVSGFYQGFLRDEQLYSSYQQDVIEQLKNYYAMAKSKKKKFKWCVILDDIVDSRSKYNEGIAELFYTGRHYGASVIFLTQKASLMNTGWVANTMIFISLFAGSRNEKQYLSDKVIADAIDGDFEQFSNREVDRIAYIIQTTISQNFNALIITPYEKVKLHQYKAVLHKSEKKKRITIYDRFDELKDK
jgi:hypothetical protein